MCGWQVKLCDPLANMGHDMSTLVWVNPLIQHYTNVRLLLLFHCDISLSGNWVVISRT